MSRGPGHVMRTIEAHLAALPEPDRLPTAWLDADILREAGWVAYEELASVVYDTDEPTRAQLSAVSRAVGRLVAQGKVERRVTGDLTGEWEKPVAPKLGRRYWQPPVRRGPIVKRVTLVCRVGS